MAFDRRFTVIAPPIPETFCVGKWAPIRVEDASTGPGAPRPPVRWLYELIVWKNRIRYESRRASRQLHGGLRTVYGQFLKVTMIEPSSSIVIRSEHQFNQVRFDRLALRFHLYELIEDEIGYTAEFREGAEFPLTKEQYADYLARLTARRPNPDVEWRDAPLHGLVGGQPITPGDVFGQYLGFLDIRPWYGHAPLALGLLVPPRRYLLDPRAYVITGDYSPIFGGPPFASTVYCMHDPSRSGAHCAQAALIMALGMLSDRGARVEGSYGLTYRGWAASRVSSRDNPHLHPGPPAPAPAPDPCCLANHYTPYPQGDRPRVEHLGVAGLTPDECNLLLGARGGDPIDSELTIRLDGLGVSSDLVTVQRDEFRRAGTAPPEPANERARREHERARTFEDRLARRLIEAYVSARFPVILYVDTDRWWAALKPKKRYDDGHAVTVIGYRRWGRDRAADERGLALLAHDPGHVPFFEQPIDTCIAAAWEYPVTERTPEGSHPGNGPAPKARGGALRFLGVADQRITVHPYACILYLWNPTNSTWGTNRPAHARTFQKYVTQGVNFRVRLAHSADLDAMFGCELRDPVPEGAGSAGPSPRERFADHKLPNARYWCVLGFDGSGYLVECWAFCATGPKVLGAVAPHPYSFTVAGGWAAPVPEEPESLLRRLLGLATTPAAPGAPTRPPVAAAGVPECNLLRASVITSCTPRHLGYLFSELDRIDGHHTFDLFAFRETDLLGFHLWLTRTDPGLAARITNHCTPPAATPPDPEWLLPGAHGSPTDLLAARSQPSARHSRRRRSWGFGSPTDLLAAGTPADDSPGSDRAALRERLVEWIAEEVRPFYESRGNGRALSFAAVATYFPDITAVDHDRRERARVALTEVVLLALGLHNRYPELFPYPVVELVCGTRVDKCECAACRRAQRCFVAEDDWKNDLLVRELVEVVRGALTVARREKWKRQRFALALELEPGDTYVLRDLGQLQRISESLRFAEQSDTDLTVRVELGDGTAVPLAQYVGFNLDIAHMLSAGISAADLEPYREQIVHAHISDLPGIHSRDQVPASFTLARYRTNESPNDWAAYAPYIELLRRCPVHPGETGPGFSGACALELEGCGRIDWVHRGVSWMRRLFQSGPI